MSEQRKRWEMFFIPKEKIRVALADLNSEPCLWVDSCDYLSGDDKFAVLLQYRGVPYTGYVEALREKWESQP